MRGFRRTRTISHPSSSSAASTTTPRGRYYLVNLLVSCFLLGEFASRTLFSSPSSSIGAPRTTEQLTTFTTILEQVSSDAESQEVATTTRITEDHEEAEPSSRDESDTTNDEPPPASDDADEGTDGKSEEVSPEENSDEVGHLRGRSADDDENKDEPSSTMNKVESVMGDEEFFDNGDPHSKTASVISFAYGYKGDFPFKKFVGSLRATGYLGHIILFVDDKVEADIVDYLERKSVTTIVLHETPCTHGYNATELTGDDDYLKVNLICMAPYPKIKMRWSKYPLAKDALEHCTTCTGPVLLTDFRDVFFQRDPFHGAKVEGLQVFEEYYAVDTTNWLTQWPIYDCYGVDTNDRPEPMLCSGTTIGTRDAMLHYLDAMYHEMLYWVDHKRCHIKSDADDQSMHNYLVYYKPEVLPSPLRAYKFRAGLVNTIGSAAGKVWEHDRDIMEKREKQESKEENERKDGDEQLYMTNENGRTWLSLDLKMADEDGFLLQLDNVTRSRVTHQVDRFGERYFDWEDSLRDQWE